MGFKNLSLILGKHRFLILVVIAVFITYLPSLSFNFAWDDYDFIVNWSASHSLNHSLLDLLKGDLPPGQTGPYRPVRSLLYSLSYSLFHTNPFYYHLQALINYLLTLILVYSLTVKILKNRFLIHTSLLIFAFHPLHIESVAWITPNFDLFGINFALLSILFFQKYLDSKYQNSYKFVSLICCSLAFFTYELTLTLPLILLAIILKKKTVPKKTLLPYFIVLAFYFFLRLLLDIDLQTLSIPTLDTRRHLKLTQLILINYVRLLFIPYPLSVNHRLTENVHSFFDLDFNPELGLSALDFSPPQILSTAFLLLTFLIMLYLSHKKHQTLYLAICLIFIPLLPVLQIFPQKGIFAERYTIISSLGFSWLAALILQTIKHKLPIKSFLPFILLLVTTSYQLIIFRRLPDWQNDRYLWSSAIKTNPHSAANFRNYARSFLSQGNVNTASALLEKAHQINPHIPTLQLDLILVYSSQKNYQKTLELGSQYLHHTPTDPIVLHLTADAACQLKNKNTAIKIYQQLINLDPADEVAYTKLIQLQFQASE